jgi:hypothetical protein
MTKRDFFKVLIKIFGLYSLVLTVFSIIPQNISNILFSFDFAMLLMVVASVLISIGLFVILLFKTDSIINLLKLDKGFDDELIHFGNLNNENILKLALLIIGGFLIIDHTPRFLLDAVNVFKYKINFSTIEGSKVNYYSLSFEALNILIGYLLITNYKSISKFIDKN